VPVAPAQLHDRPLWYRSFYWRIAISFIALVVVVLVGQSLMFSYLLTRPQGAFAPGDPNASATAIAAQVSRALAADPAVPLEPLVREAWPGGPQGVYLVMKDGRAAANREAPLSPAIRAQAAAALAGTPHVPAAGAGPTGPVVTAPVQINGELHGLVVLPPPPPRGAFSEVGRLLSLPGTLILFSAAALVGAVIFVPVRRRLRGLERAANRIGAGELGVRADEAGHDEIALLAAAFNRMSADLAQRTDALQASDRVRRQMLADVSHELRTPLTSMRGYLDTLAMPDVANDAETRARYLETARREAGRLERIVADLLDLARQEHGAAALEPRVFAIERVFEHVVRRHEREAQAVGVTITAQVSPDADQLLADPGRVEQVIGNLVANALRHASAGGTIHLAASVGPAGYRLVVEDSGDGIPAEHLPHVFDRFYKADSARSGGNGGSGLGLSIVKAIVERHGGQVTVESRPGRTVFAILLPRAEAIAGEHGVQSRPSANL
jgi:two-component system, OmpR family, sensor kinase